MNWQRRDAASWCWIAARIAGGITARTTAHLAPICDDGVSSLIKLRGEETARLFQGSQEAAVDRIEELVKQYDIACNFRRLDAYLFPAPGVKFSEAREEMSKEYDAVRKAGAAVEWTKGVPLKGFEDAPALRYPNQGTFHPLRYLRGLVAAIKDKGGQLFANSAVTKIEEMENSVRVSTDARQCHRGARGLRHQFADQRSRRAAQQDGAVPHLCDGVHDPARDTA